MCRLRVAHFILIVYIHKAGLAIRPQGICKSFFAHYCSNDEVSENDLEWIRNVFKTKKEALEELKRLETQLFSEALDSFYKEILDFATN